MASPLLNVAGVAVSPDHYIDGERVASAQRFELHSPIDQRLLGHICEAGEAEVDAAVRAAQRAFESWSRLSAAQRQPYLDRFAHEIGQRAEALCLLESNDAGVLGRICTLIGEQKANISDLRFTARKPDYYRLIVDVDLRDVEHLHMVMTALEAETDVAQIARHRDLSRKP